MVGRDRELEALRDAASSTGSATIVEGPAGIGKSRLVRELAAWARGRGGTVLVGRCSATSADTPLRPVREALLSAARTGIRPPESMRTFLPTLARVVPEWSTVSGADADPSTLVLGEGVLRLLHALARPSAPVVFIVEDLQWADAESLAVVEYLADNISESAVAIVATLRTGVEAAGTSLAHTLVARRTADAVILHALDADDVMTMARDIVGEDLPLDAAATLQARSEGVPFLIEELLAAAEPTGWSAIDDAMPGSVTAPVALRLAALPPEAVRLLQRAATLGRDFDWTVAARAAGVDESAAAELLRSCVHAQLVDVEGSGFRFHHALTRDAVLLAAGPAESKTAAAEALAALEGIDPELEGERCHAAAMLASRAGQPGRAASLLLVAAARAVRPRSAGLSRSSASSGGRGRVRRPPLRDRRAPPAHLGAFRPGRPGVRCSERVCSTAQAHLLSEPTSTWRSRELRSPPASGGWPRITPARSRRSFSKTRRDKPGPRRSRPSPRWAETTGQLRSRSPSSPSHKGEQPSSPLCNAKPSR